MAGDFLGGGGWNTNSKINYVPLAGVRPLGKQPVYNMEVNEYHNFSVNGGVIVHNCMDATRYLVKTLRLVRRANTKEYRSIWD